MKIHGLRGSELEDMINRTISDYRIKKLALIQKIPTPITPVEQDNFGHITKAYFEKKSTVDYIGLVQEIPVAFDAKECKGTKLPLKNIHKHQYEFMKEFEEQGGASFLLVLFKDTRELYYLRFKLLKSYWEKSLDIKKSELDKEYMIDVKNSIKADFLPKLQLDINER